FLLGLIVAAYHQLTAPPGKHVGEDPLAVTLAENNSQAYISWKLAGVKDRILVHIDSHIDLEWLPDQALQAIRNATSLSALRSVERDPYDIRHWQDKPLTIKNFIYPAIREGMVREVYWVTPEEDLSHLVTVYKKLVRDSVGRIPLDDLQTYRWQEGRIRVTLFGVPFIITRLEDLPLFSEPVLLDIDTDYFDPPYLGHRLTIPRLWPEDLVNILREKRLQADLVDICYSTREGYLSLEYKYLADYVATLLQEPQEDSPRLQAFRYHREGDILWHQGEYDKAIAAYQKALDLTPQAASLYYGLSLIYAAQGAEDKQDQMYQKAVALDPEYRHAQLYLGDSYYNKKLFAEAIPPYRRYLSRYPDHLLARFKLAYALAAVGRIDEAMEQYQLLLHRYPGYPYAHHNLALLLQRKGQLKEAEAEYREALRLDPFSFPSWHELGNIYAQQGKLEEARQSYQKALDLNPSYAESYYRLGLLWARKGLPRQAIQAFEVAVAIDPGFVQAYYNLGVAHARQGEVEQAISAYQKALQINPAFAAAHSNLGTLYLHLERFDEAIAEYEAALQHDPSLTLAYFNLGLAYAQQGKKEQAIQAFQRFIEEWQGDERYREMAQREIAGLQMP
ncbi:MAG: tetratricopeptide repeat protein, partial [Nitrospinota bacterium]